MSKRSNFRAALKEHGELHVYVDEVGEVEARLGQTVIKNDHFSVFDGNTRHYFYFDDVKGWYKPMEVFA